MERRIVKYGGGGEEETREAERHDDKNAIKIKAIRQ